MTTLQELTERVTQALLPLDGVERVQVEVAVMTDDEREALVRAFRASAGVEVLTLAAQSGVGLDELRARIEAMVAAEEEREMPTISPEAPVASEDDKW